MPSDWWINSLVQSIRDNGTFYLDSISTEFASTFPQKLGEKIKKLKKILPSICDPMKKYPVEEIFDF